MSGWLIYRAAFLTCFCGVSLGMLVYGLAQFARGNGWLGDKPNESRGCLGILIFLIAGAVYSFAPGKLSPLEPGSIRTVAQLYAALSLGVVGWYLVSVVAQWIRYRKDKAWIRRRTNSEWVMLMMLLSSTLVADILDTPSQ